MSTVKNGSNYTVFGFMRDELGLSGERLVAYAVVHTFTTWQGALIGNIELLEDWLECDMAHALEVLNSLHDDDLIDICTIGDRIAFVANFTRKDF